MSEEDVEVQDFEPSNMQNFVNALEQDDLVAAQDAFNTELGNRISDALDAKKIEVAASMYGSADEVTTDIDDSEMDIDVEDEAEDQED